MDHHSLLEGKRVLVTGAGANIGRATAIEMAKQGARVYFTDIDDGAVKRLERRLEGLNGGKGFVSDITDTGSTDHLVHALIEDHGGIDVLVNNVGIPSTTVALNGLNPAEWHRIFQTNLFGPMYLTKLVGDLMVSRKISGSIIFMSSVHQWTVRRYPAYSATKGAIGMVVKELALDLAKYGIRVNAVAPGYVLGDDETAPAAHHFTPLHHTSIPAKYVGRAVVYLASDFFSHFTTGTVLKVDAGLSLHNHLVDEIPID